MKPDIETGECASCLEPISAWEWVLTDTGSEPWCDVCALLHAAKCEVCKELVSTQAAYTITDAEKTVLVCPSDILTWALGMRLNPVSQLLELLKVR